MRAASRAILLRRLASGLTAALLAGCGGAAKLPLSAGFGPAPALPDPEHHLIPTVVLAPAIGWSAAAHPTPAPDLQVSAYAIGLAHPRWIHVLPNGDVLVAETGAPARPDAERGIVGWLTRRAMRRAGAGEPSAERITLLRGLDARGAAITRATFLEGLHSPFGMALIGEDFYVANTDAVLKFAYSSGATRISSAAVKIADLPAGRTNYHWTRNLLAGPDGSKLYVTVGSNSNIAETGMALEAGRASGIRQRIAQSQRTGLAARHRRPVDGRE